MTNIAHTAVSGITDGGTGANAPPPPLAAQMWAPFTEMGPLNSASFAF